MMKHRHEHEYEPVYHPNPTSEMKALGIKAIELRKCRTCQAEMTYILTKDGLFKLYEEIEPDEKDVLLA
jgi:hypothetical protein